jgi:hypothetical protein
VAQQQAWAAQQAEARTLDAYKAPTASTRVVTPAEAEPQATQAIPVSAAEGATPVGQKTYYARTVPTDDAPRASSDSAETPTTDEPTTDHEREARRETSSFAPATSGAATTHPDEGTATR